MSDFDRREPYISADEHREQAERLDLELWHEDRDTKAPQRAQEPILGSQWEPGPDGEHMTDDEFKQAHREERM